MLWRSICPRWIWQAAATSDKVSVDDGSVFGQYLAGRFARSVGDTTSASRYYELVLKRDPDNSDILTRAFLLMLADGRFEGAATLAHKIADVSQNSSLASQVLAVEQIAKGDYASAADILRKSSRSRMNALIVPLIEAWALVGNGQGEESFKTLDFLKKKKGYALFRSYHVALISDFLGQAEKAEAAYRETIDAQEGGSLRVVEAFGLFLERAGGTRMPSTFTGISSNGNRRTFSSSPRWPAPRAKGRYPPSSRTRSEALPKPFMGSPVACCRRTRVTRHLSMPSWPWR